MKFITILLTTCMVTKLAFSANQSTVTRQCPTVINTSTSGVPGVPGVPGLNGRDGAKGDQGPVGSPGDKGSVGPQGDKGLKGDQGPAGPAGDKGLVGPQGDKGLRGDQGPAGSPGKMGPKGAKGEQGNRGLQRNWKQCVWKNVDDNKDSGLIKDCVFTKVAGNTVLKVEYNGDVRIAYCLDCCSRWFFTFNGAECRKPFAIDGLMHIHVNHGRTDSNIHRVAQIGGYCEGIAKGTVRVGINVGSCVGKKAADAYTGWNSVTRIMIEEVPPSQ